MIERVVRQRLSAQWLLAAAAMLLALPPASAQVPVPPTAAQPAGEAAPLPVFVFDVASVKPNKSGGDDMRIIARPPVYQATNLWLEPILQGAYGLKMQGLVSGLPAWAQSARFDINAKMDEATADALKKLPQEQQELARQAMMQALLVDRFHLKAHRVVRELPVYALVIAPGGFKLKPADPNNLYENGMKTPDGKPGLGFMNYRHGGLTAQAIPIVNLSRVLSGEVHRLIVDRTGLTGKYDITLEWTPDEGTAPPPDSTAPPLFTALQEQLGLKLESGKAPVDTLVVDHIEQPSEN